MELIDINKNNLAKIKKGRWLLLFWVPWGKPSFDQIELIKKNTQKVRRIALINVEENRDIAMNYNICLYPTIIFLNSGIEEHREIGLYGGLIK